MARCDQCGNEYDKTFELSQEGRTWTFDSFECAIQVVAPRCGHCGCAIIGHGMETDGAYFCCANCAEKAGRSEFSDRASGS